MDDEGKHRFTLTELLEIDDSASFRVIFKTTKAGNFSNTVTAGYNNTTVSNSTNMTEVVGENATDVPDNKTTEKNESKKENKTNSKITVNKKSKSKVLDVKQNEVSKRQIDEKATGNPLMILFLALMLIPLGRFRK